jgi:hypothetical protein
MKNHEWKAMGRVIYGSGKTAFLEEKKANFAARLNCTTHHFDAAANWIEGEFNSILRFTLSVSPSLNHLIGPLKARGLELLDRFVSRR